MEKRAEVSMSNDVEASFPHFHLHVRRPSLPSHPTTCACDSLSLAYMATRTAMHLRRSRGTYAPPAWRRSWSNAARTFPVPSHVHELLSDSVSFALTADPVPPGAQVVRASSLGRISSRIAHAEQVWM